MLGRQWAGCWECAEHGPTCLPCVLCDFRNSALASTLLSRLLRLIYPFCPTPPVLRANSMQLAALSRDRNVLKRCERPSSVSTSRLKFIISLGLRTSLIVCDDRPSAQPCERAR
jgi:hypothetical protein